MNDAGKIQKIKKALAEAEYIVIGGGAGLSAAAGLDMDGEQFQENFRDFIEKYGICDLYSGGFYPFQTREEKWAFWAKHIWQNRYGMGSSGLYRQLYGLVKDKPYYVVSTNVDSLFVKSGFPDDRVFEVQGDYCYFQCEKPCHQKLYYNEEQVRKMAANIHDCRIPTELVPKCPVCGRDMDYNLRVDGRFVQDESWHRHSADYERFLKECAGKRTVFLELGVGYNTPGIIKYPFWQMTAKNPQAAYVCINYGEAVCPKEIENQSVCLDADIKNVLECLR